MYCPRCLAQIGDDSLFCAKCGFSLSESSDFDIAERNNDIEQTMAIPIINESIRDTGVSKPFPKEQKKDSKEKVTRADVKKAKVLTFVVTFFAALVVGFGIAALIFMPKGAKKKEENNT